MEVDRTKRPRSSETSEPQPPTPSRAERHALLEQDALEKERIARQARLKADLAGAVLRRRAEQALEEEALELVVKEARGINIIVRLSHRRTDGRTNRQTDRQAGRQADRQTGRQTGRQADRGGRVSESEAAGTVL